MALKTHYDFAENDYQFFKRAYDAGNYGNSMGAMAQNICEKYLKHLVEEYFPSDSKEKFQEKQQALRTHNLSRLLNFLEKNMGMCIAEEVQDKLQLIDGYYFSTRYPGDNAVELTQRNIRQCMEAINLCRDQVIGMIHEIEEREAEKEEPASLNAEDILADDFDL